MIKIISITNAHEFDGVQMEYEYLLDLIYLLAYSNFAHTIKYIDENSKENMTCIGETK